MSKKKKAQKTPVSIEPDLNTEMSQQEELTPVKKSHVRHKLHLIPLAAVVFSAAVIIAAVSRDDDDKKEDRSRRNKANSGCHTCTAGNTRTGRTG